MFRTMLTADWGETARRDNKTAKNIVLATLVFGMGMIAAPTNACSIRYKEGTSPQEIKHRPDVRKVTGVFKLTEVQGERFTNEEGKELIRDAMLIGTVIAKRGAEWKTIHPPPSALLIEMCGVDAWYHKPELDAEGTFWITRKRSNGRYRLMLWEGDYLPVTEEKKG